MGNDDQAVSHALTPKRRPSRVRGSRHRFDKVGMVAILSGYIQLVGARLQSFCRRHRRRRRAAIPECCSYPYLDARLMR